LLIAFGSPYHSRPNVTKRSKPKRGRPIKLDAALTKRVCAFLGQGVNQKTACNLAGIPYSTYNEWKQRGERDEEPFASFFSVTSRARDKHELRLLKIINDAAEGTLPRYADWKAAAWQLERGWPLEFAPYDRRPLPTEEDPDKKKINMAIVCNITKPLEELLNFPMEGDVEPSKPFPEPEYRFNQRTGKIEPLEPLPEINDESEPEPPP
jgi:hypothetical protein